MRALARPAPPFSPWIVAAALLLALPTIYNGFPFIFPDSADYLVFTPQLHRSPFYAPLITAVHLGLTPWPIVALQTLIAAHLLFLVMRTSALGFEPRLYLMLNGLILGFTMLPWIVGQIMPDVFTPVMMLAIYLLGWRFRSLLRLERLYLALLLTGAIAVHVSHLAEAIGLALLILAFLLVQGMPWREIVLRLTVIAAPIVAAALAFFAFFWVIHGIPAVSPAGPVFFMANLIEAGPARAHIAGACPAAGYRLCEVDPLPSTANELLWYSGVVERLGGFEGMRAEASQIVAATLGERPLEVAAVAISNSARQFVTVAPTGEYSRFLGITAISEIIDEKFGGDTLRAYRESRQYTGRLPLTLLTLVVQAGLAVSLALGAAVLVIGVRRRSAELLVPVIYVLACLAGNAALLGTLSGVFGRYQGRVSWLLLVVGALGVAQLVRERRARIGTSGLLKEDPAPV
jgi:hypothetical protein